MKTLNWLQSTVYRMQNTAARKSQTLTLSILVHVDVAGWCRSPTRVFARTSKTSPTHEVANVHSTSVQKSTRQISLRQYWTVVYWSLSVNNALWLNHLINELTSPVLFEVVTEFVSFTLTSLFEQSMSKLEMGKNLHCWGSVLFRFHDYKAFGSVRLPFSFSASEFYSVRFFKK